MRRGGLTKRWMATALFAMTAVVMTVEDTRGSNTGLATRAERLVAAKPDVIFTVVTASTVAAKQTTTSHHLHRAIKVLRFNGVAPTAENVLGGRYPLVKTLVFVFRQDKLPATAKAFMDFVGSVDGAALLKANGYLPAE